MVTIVIGAIVIGLTLGMLGSGGSAITVPVLHYLVGHSPKQSIAESLAIVGLISISAAIPYAYARQVDWKAAFYFGGPGMLGTVAGAALGVRSPDVLQLVVFGSVLILAAFFMLRSRSSGPDVDPVTGESQQPHLSLRWLAIEGMVVGMVTGFVGVGGGFLIVPALAILAKLPMRRAIASSLVIIVAQSATGFATYQYNLLYLGEAPIEDLPNLQTILVFAVIGIGGSFLGRAINQRLNQQKLRRIFGIFLIVLGSFVIVREAIRIQSSRQPPAPSQAAFPQHSRLEPIGPATHVPTGSPLLAGRAFQKYEPESSALQPGQRITFSR